MATFFSEESSGQFGGMEEAEISKKRFPPPPRINLLILCSFEKKPLRFGEIVHQCLDLNLGLVLLEAT